VKWSAIAESSRNTGLETAPKSKWAFCGKQSAFSRIEDELCAYVRDFRKLGSAVSIEMLQLETSKVAQQFSIPLTEFKASYRWV
jgi:hypothetical protein